MAQDRWSHEVKLLEERLRAFQAENSLLANTLRTAQSERQTQQQALAACQAENAELRRQVDTKDKVTAALRREVQDLKIVAAKRDQHLDQSLAHREELEHLVVELQTELECWLPSDDTQGPAVQHSPTRSPRQGAGGRGRRGRDQGPGTIPTLHRRIESALSRPLGSPHSPRVQAIKSTQAALRSSDLREEVARLEDLYQAKIQLVQQDADARVATVQQRHREALESTQEAARGALEAMKAEVQRQVAEAEGLLMKQVQHQDRVLEQLQKRCAALELCIKSIQHSKTQPAPSTPSTHPTPKPSESGELSSQRLAGPKDPHSSGGGGGGGVQDNNGLRAEISALRQQLQLAQSSQGPSLAPETVRLTVSAHQHQAAEAMRRLKHVRQELCTALEQQHCLTADNARLQEQVLQQTTQLAAAETAIKELRTALCDTRERLLAAQASTVADALQLAMKEVPQSRVTPQDPSMLTTYVRVLEHSLREADAREAALKRAVSECEYLEDQARRLLSASRDEQIAMRKALTQQVRRTQALEVIRLSDAREAARAMAQ